MKKTVITSILLVISSVLTSVSAQQLKLWKNGEVVYKTQVADIDSMTFAESAASVTQLEDLVGTWRIVYSKGRTVRNGATVKTWDEDVEVENNCAVFTADKTMSFMEYSPMSETGSTPGMWHADGTAKFDIVNGEFCVEQGIGFEARIISLDNDEMVMEYTFRSSADTYRTYTDTARRINKSTGVLRTQQTPDASQPDDVPYINKEDIVGTWLITYEKGVMMKNGVVSDKKNSAVEDGKCYYVIFPDNRIGVVEYSSHYGAWRLDSGEYIPYTLTNGTMSFFGGYLMQIDNGTARVYTEYPKDAGGIKMKIHTIKRVSTATDYIKYEE